jgi:hypothetical protein
MASKTSIEASENLGNGLAKENREEKDIDTT